MVQFFKFIQKPIIVKLVGGFLVFLLIVGLRNGGYLAFLELAAYDWFIRMEPKRSCGDPRITLIEISEKDIHAHGRWPLTDEALAKAMNILVKDNPRAVGLDIYRDILVPPGSEELNTIFVENPQIIGVMTFGDKGVRPPAIMSNTEQVGFNDILVDPGGIVRRALIFLDDGENVYNSFALRLASLYLHAEGIALQADPENPQYIRLRDTTIKPFEANDGGYIKADARGYQFLLDFENAGLPFRSYSFSKLLSGEVPAEAIADKIILIGVSAQSVKDFFYTPLSKGFKEVQQVPGVVLHGHIISQLLRFALDGTSPLKTLPETQKLIWILLWSITGGLIGLRIRSVLRFSMLILGGLVLLCLASYSAFLARWWIPLVPPALSFFISAVIVTAYMSSHEKKERALLMQLFSRHVSKEIAEIIWQQKDQFLNDGRPRSQKMTATVFFSDLKGFTTISEKMGPQELIDWLNAYMEPMTRLIMEHGGVIDDYAGDGIKANFGVPLPRKNEDEVRSDAMNAINCALAMEKEMCRLNAFWSQKGLPAMGTRVGIFTGTVVAGLLGSSKRLKYTTVGDTVNIAARLESYDKEVGKDALCRILIGEPTLHHVNGQFKTERIGEVSLKGKDEKITVHRVLGEESPGSHTTSLGGDPMNNMKLILIIGLIAALPFLAGAADEGKTKRSDENTQTDQKAKQVTNVDKPVYKPPLRGSPAGRVGGGTRGMTERESFSLQVLVPDHIGLTIQDQPCLYWYVSKPIPYPVELTVIERNAVKPLLEKIIKGPDKGGIQFIRLADYAVHLRQNVPYKWFVTLVTDSNHRSKDILAGGIITLVEPPPSLSAKLKAAGSGKAPYIYAEEGLWYDALGAISGMIDASPNNVDLRKQRASLLEQVGLAEVADFENRR